MPIFYTCIADQFRERKRQMVGKDDEWVQQWKNEWRNGYKFKIFVNDVFLSLSRLFIFTGREETWILTAVESISSRNIQLMMTTVINNTEEPRLFSQTQSQKPSKDVRNMMNSSNLGNCLCKIRQRVALCEEKCMMDFQIRSVTFLTYLCVRASFHYARMWISVFVYEWQDGILFETVPVLVSVTLRSIILNGTRS